MNSGGGSSFSVKSNAFHEQGVRSGNGYVVITYYSMPLAEESPSPSSFPGPSPALATQSPVPTPFLPPPVPSISGNLITFNNTGIYNVTVPMGVISAEMIIRGAGGGTDNRYSAVPEENYAYGGYGAIVSTIMTVTPGQILHVLVGGKGDDRLQSFGENIVTMNGGFNGGGRGGGSVGSGGGGASDIRTHISDPSSRLIVAGGGGGGTGSCGINNNNYGAKGGNGGTPVGENGINLCATCPPPGGGTLTQGGSSCTEIGGLGFGGSGNYPSQWVGNGGGGGGGYYGGGGGSHSAGGGGSSFCDSSVCASTTSYTVAQELTNGFVSIKFITQSSPTTLPPAPSPSPPAPSPGVPTQTSFPSALPTYLYGLNSSSCVIDPSYSKVLLENQKKILQKQEKIKKLIKFIKKNIKK